MPINLTLFANLILYAFVVWLGAYLVARGSHTFVLRLTGLGLLCYAVTFIADALGLSFARLTAFLPGLLWIGATLYWLPEELARRNAAIRVWWLALLPLALAVYFNPAFGVVVVLGLFACVGVIGWLVLSGAAGIAYSARSSKPLAILALVTLFFGLSTGLLLAPTKWLPQEWVWLALGIDLLLLGLVILVWDAFDEGAVLQPHLARSFVGAFFYAAALSAIVLLASSVSGFTSGTWLLLAGVIAFGIFSQVFAEPLASFFDRLSFAREPALTAQREMLREAMEVLPLVGETDPLTLDEAEFVRLTRRALSSMGDLSKLAVSPLTNLPAVRRQSPNPLNHAQALKLLVTASIVRLKPPGKGEFGTTDEWRHYNALYFPYVVGIKPYSRREESDLDPAARKALEWFRATVPERTLHNWQNAAAKLVAQDLRNQL